MPILNTKLLLRILIVAMLLAGGLAGLHTVQAARVPDALLWQANSAAEKGKTDKAIFYLKQYLEFRPDDHDAAIRLADLIAERTVSAKDLAGGQFLYEKVLREDPQRLDVAKKLVHLCLRMGRHGDALTHADRLLRETPNDGDLLADIAECQVAQGRAGEARESFEQAVTHAPRNVRAHEQYARLLARHFDQPAAAEVVLDRLAKANPERADVFLVRARFFREQEKDSECLRELDRVFALEAGNAEALVMSAEVLQNRGEIARARGQLRNAVELHPRFAYAYRALSWLELSTGNPAEARAVLERGVASLSDSPELLMPLADLWIDQGELPKVNEAIRKLESRRDSAARADYLRGRLLMKQEKWPEAVAAFEALRSDTVALPGLAPQLNVLLAACHGHVGEQDAQIEALKRALAGDPKHLTARVALANAYLDSGRLDDAMKEYDTATRLPESTDIRVLAVAARFHTLKNEPGAAIEVIHQFVGSAKPGSEDEFVRRRQAAELFDQLAKVAHDKNLPATEKALEAAGERYRAPQ